MTPALLLTGHAMLWLCFGILLGRVSQKAKPSVPTPPQTVPAPSQAPRPAVGSTWTYRNQEVDVMSYDDDLMTVVARDGRLVTTPVAYFCAVAVAVVKEPETGSTLGRLSPDGCVRLPPTVVQAVHLKPGDFVHYLFENERVYLVNEEAFDRYLCGDAQGQP